MHIRFKRISRVFGFKVPHEQKQAVRERRDENFLDKTHNLPSDGILTDIKNHELHELHELPTPTISSCI